MIIITLLIFRAYQIRSDVEKIKDMNFQFSEGLMAEYEGKIQYSGV